MGVDALRMEAEVSVTNERVQNDRRLRMVLSCSSSLLLLFVRALSLVDLVVLIDTPLAKDDEGDGWNAAADNSRERKTSDAGFMFYASPSRDIYLHTLNNLATLYYRMQVNTFLL